MKNAVNRIVIALLILALGCPYMTYAESVDDYNHIIEDDRDMDVDGDTDVEADYSRLEKEQDETGTDNNEEKLSKEIAEDPSDDLLMDINSQEADEMGVVPDTENEQNVRSNPSYFEESRSFRFALNTAYTFAVTPEGNLFSWGDGRCFAHGNGSEDNIYLPTHANKLGDIEYLAQGWVGAHYAAINRDGDLYMWGANGFGQVGVDSNGEDVTAPVKIMSNVRHVSLGSHHSAAITYDGDLYMWGLNSYGELGIGNYESQNKPIKVMSGVKCVSLGWSCSAAVTNDGRLYTWGFGQGGRLGRSGGNIKPLLINALTDVENVSMGDEFGVATLNNGDLYAWGTIYTGDLETELYSTPQKINSGIKYVQAGSDDAIVLTDNNEVYIWGYATKSTFKKIEGISDARSVGCGLSHYGVLTENGDLYLWGFNQDGQLGNGSALKCENPIKVFNLNTGKRYFDTVKTFSIDASAGVGGTITPTGKVTAVEGEYVDFKISPDDDYSIKKVLVDDCEVEIYNKYGMSYQFPSVADNHKIVAYFENERGEDKYYSIVAKSNGNGRIITTVGQTIPAGGGALYTFRPNDGYDVVSVFVDGENLGEKRYYAFFNVQKNHTLEVYFGKLTATDLFTTYPAGLITEKTYSGMYNELMEQMIDILNEYNNEWIRNVVQAIKYNMKNGAFGNLKTGIEGEFNANWTKDKLTEELTRQLVADISKNDKTLEELRGKMKSTHKYSDKYFSLISKGVKSIDERDKFIDELAKTFPYDKAELKNTYLTIQKSSKFKKLEEMFKGAGIAVNIADVMILTIETCCMNKELVTTLRDNIPEGTDLHKSLDKLAKEQAGSPLVDEALKVIEKELLEKKLLSGVLNASIEVVGEWLVEKFYGLKGFDGPSTSVALGGLIMYFGSYLIGEPSAEDVIKASLALDNMLILRSALNNERFALRNGLNGKQVSDCIYVDSLLYNSSLAALDNAYKAVISAFPDDKTRDLQNSYKLIRNKLSYEANINSCIANAKAQWTPEKNSFSSAGSDSAQSYDVKASDLSSDSVVIKGVSIKDVNNPYYIDIPEKISGKKVTGIGSNVFANDKKLVAVSIPKTVETIGDSCFQNASSLVRAYMHPGLIGIDKNAFKNCKKLNYVDIPVTVEYIDWDAFAGTNNITICGEKGSKAETYADYKGFTFVQRNKSIKGIEIAQLPYQLTMGISDAIDTTGLKLRVNYIDGSQETISKGFTCTLNNRIVGKNTVEVFYEGFSTTYQIELAQTFIPVNSIKVSPSSKTLKKGKSVTLKVNITPTNASNKAVLWESSNTKVAKVNSKGKVTAVGPGTAKITAIAKGGGNKKSKSTIKVPGISLNTSNLVVRKGKTNKKVEITVTNDKIKSVKSNNKNISVKLKGKNLHVTGKKIGKATITIVSKSGIKKKLKVTVQKDKVTTKKLKVSKSSLTLDWYEDNAAVLTVKATPDIISTGEKITVKSSDQSVATCKLDKNTGKITISSKFIGKCKITVKAGKIKKIIKVNVIDVD